MAASPRSPPPPPPSHRLQVFLRSLRHSDTIWDTQSFSMTPGSPPGLAILQRPGGYWSDSQTSLTGHLQLQVEFIVCLPQWNGKIIIKNASHYLTAAEYIAGRRLDVEVSEDPNSLIFSLFWTVKGQAATFADLGPQLHKMHHESVDAACSRRDASSYLLWGKAVHRWVWHGLQLGLTDTHTENDIIYYIESVMWSIQVLLLTNFGCDSVIITVLQHDHVNSQTAQGPPESLQHVVTHHP